MATEKKSSNRVAGLPAPKTTHGPRPAKKAAPRGAIINVRVKPETKVRMEAMAAARGRTLSAAVEHLIELELYMEELSLQESGMSKTRSSWLDRIRLKVGSFFG